MGRGDHPRRTPVYGGLLIAAAMVGATLVVVEGTALPTFLRAVLLVLAGVAALAPTDRERACRFSVAAMELGALVCVARTPRCAVCPVRDRCAWRLAGSPAHDGPARRVQRFAGTDRQVRGRLLDVLRAAEGPVAASLLDGAWDDAAQRSRCLDSLLADGLVEQTPDGRFTLPA